MPEYLHPGVYVEETSYRGKPIEGVSTSTAGFVGKTRYGREGVPTLVTSYTQFVREFGQPYPSPSERGEYLGHAMRGFFDNGGKRAWIVRVLPTDAAAADSSSSTASQGTILRLGRNVSVVTGGTTLKLNSLRGVNKGDTIDIYYRDSENDPWSTYSASVTAIDLSARTVTLGTGAPSTISWQQCYISNGIVSSPPAAGPVFTALDRGSAGDDLEVLITPTDRPPVRITDTFANGDTTDTFTVTNSASFYTGATVEVQLNDEKWEAIVVAVDTTAKTVQIASTLTIGAAYDPSTDTGNVRILEIQVDVLRAGETLETFTNLTWNSDTAADSYARYYVEKLNDADTGSRYVTVTAAATEDGTLATQPTSTDGLPIELANGSDGVTPISVSDIIGADNGPGSRTGIQALKERDDVSMVAVPGETEEEIQQALITHCELMRYRVAVLDGEVGNSVVTNIESHRNNYDSTRAAYYAPWLETMDLSTGRTLLVPPSGHVMGIYARSDNERGVHKAPANEVVRSITDLEFPFTAEEQDVLNPEGINLIREFTGRGIRVWGARTLSSDSEWKYLNVRRLFNYVEHSIDNGTQWVVFEPNNEALWARVVSTISAFLFGVWKTGALMGTSPKEAYFVKCDRTTMTQDDIDNGRLVCLIGLAPTKPAEFVIFRVGQFTATSDS